MSRFYSTMNIHRVSDVTVTSAPHYDNDNAITLRVALDCGGGEFCLTVFGLPTERAEAIAAALHPGVPAEDVLPSLLRLAADRLEERE